MKTFILILWITIVILTGPLSAVRDFLAVAQPSLQTGPPALWAWVRIAFVLSAGTMLISYHSKIRALEHASAWLAGDIVWVLPANRAFDIQDTSNVWVTMRIRNSGRLPSVATDWRLTVQGNRSNPLKRWTESVGHARNPFGNAFAAKTHVGSFNGADSLRRILKERLLDGDYAEGWVCFEVDRPYSDLIGPGKKWTVQFCDISGKKIRSVSNREAIKTDPKLFT